MLPFIFNPSFCQWPHMFCALLTVSFSERKHVSCTATLCSAEGEKTVQRETRVMLLSQCVWCCVVLSVLAVSVVTASNYSCPTWFYYSNTTQRCECGFSTLGWIVCDQETKIVTVNRENCVTDSGQDGLYYIGRCLLNYKFNNTNRVFSELPTDPDLLEDMVCGPYNRKGLLCEHCIDGYGPGVYTLDSACADCSKFSTLSAILLYLLVDLVPITLFFICVVLFRLNVTAGPLLGYVLFCQIFSVSLKYEPLIYHYTQSQLSPVLVSVLFITFESWNLNFLKPVIPPFCISEKVKGIHVLALNSLSAVYPIFLVMVLLVVIELHSRNNTIVRVAVKPFRFVLKKTSIKAVTGDAVLRTFATFVFLSTAKNLFTFYAMIRFYHIFKSIDGTVYKRVLLADPTIDYLSPTHIMFMIIPLLQCLFLVFIPSLILIIYPTRLYRSLSQFISARKQLAITSFVESLNGCFKDGLNGTRDYRAYAGLVMLFPLCILVVSYLPFSSGLSLEIRSCYVFSLLSLLISYKRPFKSTVTNMSVSYCFIVFGLGNVVVYLWYYQVSVSSLALEVAFFLTGISVLAPVVVWTLYKVTCYVLRRISTTC